ncbi:uncharacterized protein METZ01_LOCUS497968 [marine metagenome]|uniref:Uncharacterized protein n=1 Tax=marine metagenome TaxID=408172 RepID=A0A383DLA8_9ZZZZ
MSSDYVEYFDLLDETVFFVILVLYGKVVRDRIE